MPNSPEEAPLVKCQSMTVTLQLILLGIALIVIGNAVECEIWKIDVGEDIVHVGALLLIVGVLQWFFDRHVRATFFSEIRDEILGSSMAARSGICGFYADSKDVKLDEYFLSSTDLIIGVNYSGKLIDNCSNLLRARTSLGYKTTIVTIKPGTAAETFLAADYSIATTEIAVGLKKIDDMVADLDPGKKHINVVQVNTVLRYSFIRFDSRIWVIVSTNGLGRRSVPGFFVSRATPWFDHFKVDIDLLMNRK